MSLFPLLQISSVFGGVGVLVLFGSSRARGRWLAFLDVQGTKGSTGYQVYQSLLSIANGGATGVGVGQGSGKWGYLPLSYSDFIFAIIAEELGIIGSLSVLGAFIAITVVGVHVAIHARELFGAFLAGGITAWFAIQALVNIGGVTASMPVTGLTLPFISYGGSSLLVSMAAAGVLLNVARNMK
jgi:cell division protein FtsW